MEARLMRAAVLLCVLLSFGASYRTTNFICTAPTPELAKEICEQAEVFRRDLAIEWLGQELPDWQQPCPIKAQVSPQMGAGGQTSFAFNHGHPCQWDMLIQGSRERILDSVLPHEVTHTIFATHFGQPLPRWADEGACTTVEADSERAKQDKMLIQFLTSRPSRAIAFNRMFAMREYPADIMPLYSQGYSVAMFLLAQGGKRKFIDFVGEGLATQNWTAATNKFYSFRSLSDLQVTWLEWVRRGSPAVTPEVLAELRGGQEQLAAAEERAAEAAASSAGQASPEAVAAAAGGSWYVHQRDMPAGDRSAESAAAAASESNAPAEESLIAAAASQPLNWVAPQPGRAGGSHGRLVEIGHATTRPQMPEQARQTILQWSSTPASGQGQNAAWQPGSVRYDPTLPEGVIRR